MGDLIDITLPLHEELPVWPTDRRFRLLPDQRIDEGAEVNASSAQFSLHTGTHVDAPWHFVPNGRTVEQLALKDLVGPAHVAHLPGIDVITPDVLGGLGLAPDTRRLLLRTDNSLRWKAGETEFDPNFVALTPDAAEWVVEQDIILVGVDYLSVQCFHDPDNRTHETLLSNRVIIVEGLDLAGVGPGEYELICLPLKIMGADGAPARALLKRIGR